VFTEKAGGDKIVTKSKLIVKVFTGESGKFGDTEVQRYQSMLKKTRGRVNKPVTIGQDHEKEH